ncbi:ABC transporter ATP-binding protein [Eremococcus coleocola]|uniref:ABC transporter, ATP-binding protein n=1 Tax=Eremococcus coleocola ACS-139-V-Col8 TaxID=908337 RepID=E4KM63_9LACT|nr:ABC transporter ATP-binding protein [Eremococcus coleocola]EFR32114.1 ABC transporter, ATP-binding protein [Eremococcus coleocola ACS-139-V-Col8]
MLEVKNLHKSFGDLVAVDDVSFTIEPGQIMGLIGQNGSGKTTIFRMILDFLTPEGNGQVLWKGQSMNKQVYNVVGYLPEERGLYDKMTIEDQIIYFALLRGMKRSEIIDRIDDWMQRFQVKGSRKDKVKTLSKGNQQKVQLIATLIHEPELIILDEPFSGLDPVNADLLKDGIRYLSQKGSSIIFSSHNMSNVEEICDKLLMIHNGEQRLYGTLKEVRESYGRIKLYIEGGTWTQDQLANLDGVTEVKPLSQGGYLLHLANPEVGANLYETLTQGRYLPVFNQQPPTLEEIFKMEAGGHHG